MIVVAVAVFIVIFRFERVNSHLVEFFSLYIYFIALAVS